MSVSEKHPVVGEVYDDTLFNQRLGVKYVEDTGQPGPIVLLYSFEHGGNVAYPLEKFLSDVGERFEKRPSEVQTSQVPVRLDSL